MNPDLFEVTRDDYVGFLDQIKRDCKAVKKSTRDNLNVLEVYSKNTDKLLCARTVNIDDNSEKFYIYNMPENEERQASPARRKIVLETKEEVQAFFDILSKVSKNND